MKKYNEYIQRRIQYGDIRNYWAENYVKYRDYMDWAAKFFGLSCLIFVPLFLFSLVLLFNGFKLYAILIVLGIMLYSYLLFKFFRFLDILQGRRFKRMDEWPLKNKQLIEEATAKEYGALSKQAESATAYFIETPFPLAEIQLYQNIDERVEYLKTIPTALNYINYVIEQRYPFLSKVSQFDELGEVIKLFSDVRFIDSELLKNPNVYPEARDVEQEIFTKHGINLTYIEQLNKYFHSYAFAKFENIIETYNKESAILNLGVSGEEKLKQALDLHCNEMKILYNVRLEVEGQSIETDALVFAQSGVYSLEVKNFGSSGKYSITIAADGQWIKSYPNGNREPMKDVTAQTNRHIAYQKKFLALHTPKLNLKENQIKTKSIIVIGNDNVFVTNNSSQPIIRTSEIYNLITSEPPIYSKEDIEQLYDLFNSNSLPPQKFPYRDLVAEYNNLVDALSVLFDLKIKFRKARIAYWELLNEKVPKNYFLLRNHVIKNVASNYTGCRVLSTEQFTKYLSEENDNSH